MDITIDVNDYKLNVRAACVIKHNNKILVHKNINSNYYCLIGGRVKIGEDSETTIKREVEEEIGKQIGNAVPVLLAETIGRYILGQHELL